MRGLIRFAAPLCSALLVAACASIETQAPSGTRQPGEAPRTAGTAPEPAVTPEVQALQALVALQDRLYRIGAPLLVNNPQLCRGNARNLLGFTAKNKYSYSSDYVNAAQNGLNLNDRLQVTGVLAGGGAARAGVRPGDALVGVEDKKVPHGENAERGAAEILAPLMASRTTVRLTVVRNGTQQTINVPLTNACAFGLEVGNTGNVVAYADGHRILVARGMINATRSDEELAYVVAKEMAHNILGHAARQKMSATVADIIDNLTRIQPDMSTMAGMAGVKPMPQELDAMADKLSLYLLARAGYGIDGVIPFWQRLSIQYPATVLNGYTALHPALAYRVQAMEKTVAEIKAKQAKKRPLVP